MAHGFVYKIHWTVTCPFTEDKDSAIEESVLSAYMTENKLEKTFAIPAVIASLPFALHEQIVLDHVDRSLGAPGWPWRRITTASIIIATASQQRLHGSSPIADSSEFFCS
jgi:hypothetical protein